MYKVKVKPLSVNKCWRGRRFKTSDYTDYETELLWSLPKSAIKVYDKMTLKITFGFSSKLADIDNPLKPLIDILQKQYNFNDKQIFRMEVEKKIVRKGGEYIEFNIKPYK